MSNTIEVDVRSTETIVLQAETLERARKAALRRAHGHDAEIEGTTVASRWEGE